MNMKVQMKINMQTKMQLDNDIKLKMNKTMSNCIGHKKQKSQPNK